MKHAKVGLTFVLVLAVLVAAFFGSVYLANKAKQKEMIKDSSTQTQAGNIYTNNEFGFSLDLPDDWTDYKVEQSEGDLLFYFPTTAGFTDPVTNKVEKYAPLFDIIATPIDEARSHDKKCLNPDPYDEGLFCTKENKLGENNYYQFDKGVGGIDYAPDFQNGKIDQASQIMSNIKIFDIQKQSLSRTFNRINSGFSLEYPTGLFTPAYGVEVWLPIPESSYLPFAHIELSHVIKVQYCALSGKCTPTTIDMKIGVANIPQQSMAQLKKTSIGQELVMQTYGNNEALVLTQGAEGEGMNYYFIENPNGGLLMLYHKYIDENVVTKYKKAQDFIPYNEQGQIIEDILKSIKFTK